MSNDPSPGKNRRPHPLEQQPRQINPGPEGSGDGDKSSPQRGLPLRIPLVQPRVTYALIAINSVVFVIAWYVLSASQFNELYNWGANNHRAVLQSGEIHRLFTSMFLHGGLVHLVFNMYALHIIGQTVERFYGHVRFVILYFLGGLSGSLLSVLLNPPSVTSVGASGAVFAIFGAQMILLYKHKALLGTWATLQLRQLIIIAGINFAYGIATTFSAGGVNIDNWGHIGGFVGGMILAWFMGPIFVIKGHGTLPGVLAAEDINPIQDRYPVIGVFALSLVGLLLIGSFVARM